MCWSNQGWPFLLFVRCHGEREGDISGVGRRYRAESVRIGQQLCLRLGKFPTRVQEGCMPIKRTRTLFQNCNAVEVWTRLFLSVRGPRTPEKLIIPRPPIRRCWRLRGLGTCPACCLFFFYMFRSWWTGYLISTRIVKWPRISAAVVALRASFSKVLQIVVGGIDSHEERLQVQPPNLRLF